jgi:S1-C subfamily serine protease
MVMIINVAQLMNDLDAKTDVIVSVLQENKVPTLPNFENLVRANVVIGNLTQSCGGSGTTINVDGKTYILSAGHLGELTDTFIVREGFRFRDIKMVKQNKDVDLALFEYVDGYVDLTTAPIAVETPKVGDKIWAVGNPAMLEDAVTGGTLVKKVGYVYFIDAKIYYGSSGGGLFNTKGELIGVNVAMTGVNPVLIGGVNLTFGVTVNLKTIKAFIEGRIPSDI